MESFMVFKIKYGRILRRLSVRVHCNKLALDTNRLRAIVQDLFNFSSDTHFTMTYIDEDGDKVALVNDDDLHDVMSQQLKFLRINVHLRNEKGNQFHDRLDGSSTSQTPANVASSLVRLAKAHMNSDAQSSSSVLETSTQNVATASSMATKNIRVDAPNIDLYSPPLYFPPATHLGDDIINEFSSGRRMCLAIGAHRRGGYNETMVPKGPRISRSGCIQSTKGFFHKGVSCDGCGAHPIIGSRFMSLVKLNYDLCSICFAEVENDSEYLRIDCTVSPYPRMRACKPGHSFVTGLDSCLVNVNALDDTVVPPLASFTKTWRLRNTGTSNWPPGTQLELAGGVMFSYTDSVELKVPAHGLPVGEEIDVAVQFGAPRLSGRFRSYWALTSPSDHWFGDLVWISILIDPALGPDTSYFEALDLNLPPTEIGSGDLNGHEDVENNSTPAVSDDPSSIAMPVKPDPNLPVSGAEQRFNVNEKSPGVDNHGHVPDSTTKVSVTPSSEKLGSDNQHNEEEILVRTLGDMGFKHMDLNKEVLWKTGYDLEKTMDELCGVAEWDPMVLELEEMVGKRF